MLRANLNVLAEQVGVETDPVARDIESSLQQDVPQESTRVH